MFGLMYGLYEQYFRPTQYQLLIIGLDDAGKTTFLEQIRHIYNKSTPASALTIPPTVGLNLVTVEYNNQCKLLLWDLGGQSSLRILWEKYYAECNIVIYILDSCKFSFEQRQHEHTVELNKLLQNTELYDCPIIICCNKIDLNNNLSIDYIQSQLHLNDTNPTRTIKYIAVSALQGTNVESTVKWCVDTSQSSQRSKRISASNT